MSTSDLVVTKLRNLLKLYSGVQQNQLTLIQPLTIKIEQIRKEKKRWIDQMIFESGYPQKWKEELDDDEYEVDQFTLRSQFDIPKNK